MTTLWFCLVLFVFAIYVVLDGFDLGAGVVQFLTGKTSARRAAIQGTLGGVWDGNEVWLIAGGGTLFMAFPAAFAAAFSGMYLAFMIVLWLLILRGCALEFRGQLDNDLWQSFWDVVFAASSAMLALLLGIALGNIVRGMPLDAEARAFLPLWQDLTPSGKVGVIDWYTVLIGLTAVVALARHACMWIVLRTHGELETDVKAWGARLFPVVAAMTALAAIATWFVQPNLAARMGEAPWGYALYLLVAALLVVSWRQSARGANGAAFAFSCAYLFAMVACAGFTIFPYILPGVGADAVPLHTTTSSTTDYGLSVALFWWVPGIALATGYFVFLYRQIAKGVIGGH